MDKQELSIGLLRDKLRDFGDVDYVLDHKITEAYVSEPQKDLDNIKAEIAKQTRRVSSLKRALAFYDFLRFLNFLYYLAPFALVFGILSFLLSNRGYLLLLLPLLAVIKFAVGKSISLRLREAEDKLGAAEAKAEALRQEGARRKDERETLLARAGVLAAEIRYLESYLKDAT